MYRFQKNSFTDNLRDYVAYLHSIRSYGTHLKFLEVTVDGVAPLANNCHENSRIFVDENPEYEVVDGWICIDMPSLSQCHFLAHSVIKDVSGDLYEITPMNSLDPRPFVRSNLSEEDFSGLVIRLNEISQSSTLIHYY